MPTKWIIPAITAAEARQLVAEHNARPDAIQPWLDYIHDMIRKAAGAGQTSIWDPFGKHLSRPSPVAIRAIVVALRDEGYGVGYEGEISSIEGRGPSKGRGLLHIVWG